MGLHLFQQGPQPGPRPWPFPWLSMALAVQIGIRRPLRRATAKFCFVLLQHSKGGVAWRAWFLGGRGYAVVGIAHSRTPGTKT